MQEALLSKDTNVLEFLDILKNSNMQATLQDFSAVVNYIDDIGKQLDTALTELQGIKAQLNTLQERKNPLKAAYINVVEKLEVKITALKEQFTEIKTNFIDGVKKAVDNFKQKGVLSLDGIVNFFGIKNKLNDMRDGLKTSIDITDKAVTNIDAISSELHGIGSHTKNIGRVIAGKEQDAQIKPNGKITKAIQAPFRSLNNVLSKAENIIAATVGKLEQLELAAGTFRNEKGKTADVVQKAVENAPVSFKSEKAAEKSDEKAKTSIKDRVEAIKAAMPEYVPAVKQLQQEK